MLIKREKNKTESASIKCQKCESTVRQYKIGKTKAGSQRYKCSTCGHRYTPIQKPRGYKSEIRQKAIRLYLEGKNMRFIGRNLGIHHTTVSNWIKSYLENLPDYESIIK